MDQRAWACKARALLSHSLSGTVSLLRKLLTVESSDYGDTLGSTSDPGPDAPAARASLLLAHQAGLSGGFAKACLRHEKGHCPPREGLPLLLFTRKCTVQSPRHDPQALRYPDPAAPLTDRLAPPGHSGPAQGGTLLRAFICRVTLSLRSGLGSNVTSSSVHAVPPIPSTLRKPCPHPYSHFCLLSLLLFFFMVLFPAIVVYCL